jgi:hypothetical protein
VSEAGEEDRGRDGLRFDPAAADAKAKAAEAADLHAKGKHQEAEQAAKDGLKALGM